MDMELMREGLTISAFGLSITFLALGIFIFVMIGLQKLFPHKPVSVAKSTAGETTMTRMDETVSAVESSEQVTEEIAAIAAAIAHLRALGQSSLGTSLEAGRGPWWVKNRLAADKRGRMRK